jgi:hypothetical protein
MSGDIISSKVNEVLCEAFDCFQKATVQIEVQIGHSGTLSLNLCNKCVPKFQEGNNEVSSAYSTEYSTLQLRESKKI